LAPFRTADRQLKASNRDVLDVATARSQLMTSLQTVTVARLEHAQVGTQANPTESSAVAR
jgi:hypothetical protein